MRPEEEGEALSTALWISVLILSLGLGYSLYFADATLALGRELSDTGVGRGAQDAVTPPWEANFGLTVYSLTLASVVLSWYEFGVGRAIGTVAAFLAGTMLWRRVLPKSDSMHYKKLIVVSMTRRCANWQKSNDLMRAHAMAELLRKVGIDLPGMPRPTVAGELHAAVGPESIKRRDLIAAFGKGLEPKLPLGEIHDASELPASKEDIRDALRFEIALELDAKRRDVLEAAMLLLCQFQSGVGARPLDPLGLDKSFPADPSKLSKAELIELAKKIAANPDRARYENFERIVAAEREKATAGIASARLIGASMPEEKRRHFLSQ
jgi:hypothetical protein